jgi:hypothetical protein
MFSVTASPVVSKYRHKMLAIPSSKRQASQFSAMYRRRICGSKTHCGALLHRQNATLFSDVRCDLRQ